MPWAGRTLVLVRHTLRWRWFEPRARWWEPYVWVVVCAGLAGVLVLLLVLVYASEILRALRMGG